MPERIGRFRIDSMLGRGAMGVVYRGHDEEIDRLVAIKLIRADLLDTNERDNYIRRFRNEAKIVGRCVHASIVSLYDFATHEGNPYLVMEYVNGVGLQQAVSRGSKRPVNEALHVAQQVLGALRYAHEQGIIHRDIKPANLLLTPQFALKITDFGISRLTSMELTATPLLIGTPSYMSPEQCIGTELDGRSDLFSLGCVLYELLAGEKPFQGVNYADVIFTIVNKPNESLSRFRDDLPNGLSEVIDRALAKNADDRFPDAASFGRALSAIVQPSGDEPIITSADTAFVPHAANDKLGLSTIPPFGPSPDVESHLNTANSTIVQPMASVTQEHAPEPEPVITGYLQEAGTAASRPTDEPEQIATGTATPSIPPLQVPAPEPQTRDPLAHAAEVARITRCLAEIMGPIAPLLVWRAKMQSTTVEGIVSCCAGFVHHDDERAHFVDMVSHPGRLCR